MTISVSESKWRSPKRAQISTCVDWWDITSLCDYSVVRECQHHPWRDVDLSKQLIFVWYWRCIRTFSWLVNTKYSALVRPHLFIDDSNHSEVKILLAIFHNRFFSKIHQVRRAKRYFVAKRRNKRKRSPSDMGWILSII